MGPKTIALALVALSYFSAQRLRGQSTPAAVIADPAVDKQYPPRLAMFTVPSHGADLDAWLYVASGAGPHGTVILAHGLPGYEISEDLAQSIRRAGWNVLMFHYRGTWGVSGDFSQSSAIEDTTEVVRFLRQPANIAKYHFDSKRLILIGHSFGGFIAGYEAAHDPNIKAVAMIAAVNLGKIGADPAEREARLKRWEAQLHPVHGTTAADLFAEAERHAQDWDYVQWADALRARPVLLVEADDQNHADMEALASALKRNGAVALEQAAVATDHSFSDHRIALQSIVIRWLHGLGASTPAPTSQTGRIGRPRESQIPAGGAQLYARDLGNGVPIIVLHGGPDFDHRYLLPELDRLSDSYRLVYYDQRGRGLSAEGVRPEDVTLNSDIEDIERVRDHFKLNSVVLLGHSWGTVLALEYALRFPERVSGLILMNPSPACAADYQELRKEWMEKRPEDMQRRKAVADSPAYRQGDPEAVTAYYRIHFKPALARQEDYEKIIARMGATFTSQGVLKARAVEARLMNETWASPDFDLLPKLKALRMPALVITGDHEFIPAQTAEHIAQAIPNARLVTLKDCGHFSYLESPDAVHQEIDNFLRK